LDENFSGGFVSVFNGNLHPTIKGFAEEPYGKRIDEFVGVDDGVSVAACESLVDAAVI
jgi:hypothetical protein